MADGERAEELAAQAADAVRRAVADAAARAEQIVREAEAEAARIRERAGAEAGQIRERAEADARAQIQAARKALDDLGGSLAAAVSVATPGGASSAPEAESEPTLQPTSETEPQPPEPEPQPEPPPESPGAPEAPITPPTQESGEAAPEADAAPGNGDEAAVRLVAMKLAVEGMDPAAIEAELIERFGPGDRTELLKEVISRASSA